ncbi:MAG: cysteine--tRNA ligase [Acidimicrobiia bacterium]
MSGAPFIVFNSLGRELQEFQPIEPGQVRMYSCGPTVYSYQHLGNMRAYVFADTLKRALRWKGFEVHHVINITDVGHLVADADQGEDKIEAAARREDKTVWDITRHYTEVFWEDLARLNVGMPDEWTKATDFVPQMIEFAKVLEAKGVTYQLDEGLYLDTAKVAHYGELARMDHSQLEEGARIGEIEGRRNPTDFALWRTYSDPERRLMWWDSPWGPGAPGWHLECSVMSIERLGAHFDIHTGGIDHVEVHHPNEIAQSEAWLDDGTRWVNYWMHNEYLLFGGSKMAKSAGKVALLSDLMAQGIHPLAFRFFLLGAHYRTQLDFVDDAVVGAQTGLVRLGDRLLGAVADETVLNRCTYDDAMGRANTDSLREFVDAVDAAISDDLATPRVVAAVNAALRGDLDDDGMRLVADVMGAVLGIDAASVAREKAASADVRRDELAPIVEDKIAERNEARKNKDFATADRIRDELAELGIEIKDGPDGTTWTAR